MTIKTISDRCNKTYEHYIIQPMIMCEREINMIIAKNPQLIKSLDRNKTILFLKIFSYTIYLLINVYIKCYK